MTRALGWHKPTDRQLVRALMHAHPSAGDSVLADIVAAPTSDNSSRTVALDQGQLGSCTANAIAQALYMAMVRAGVLPFIAARLAIYFWERFVEGTQAEDAGAIIGDGFAQIAQLGIPREVDWPYEIANFAMKPGPAVYRSAYESRGQIGINYHPISTAGETRITDIEKACTAGMGVVFGVEVSERFCSEQPSGTVEAPAPTDKIAGGHAMCVIGHDRENRRALVHNSWGSDWGDPDAPAGCFWMSYDWLKLASDLWIVLAFPKGGAQ